MGFSVRLELELAREPCVIHELLKNDDARHDAVQISKTFLRHNSDV
jgi:hypothetical protein